MRSARQSRGFTLVEMLGAMTIVGVAGLAATTVATRAVADVRDASTAWSLHQDTAAALDRIVQEVRAVAKDATTGGPAVSLLSATQITLASGVGIQFIDATGSTPGRIDLTSGGTTSTLLSNVTSMSVSVLSGTGTALPLPLSTALAAATARRITITLSATRNGVTETLRTSIYLRSLAGS